MAEMKFRGTDTKGWVVIVGESIVELEENLNAMMSKYEFLDCQYSITPWLYTALVLLGKKNDRT